MKSKVIRLNEEEVSILETAIKSQLRVCDPELIRRSEVEQAQVDLYAKKLKRILGKLYL